MNLQEWIGKSETVSDIATATPYAALSATLDRAPERPPAGTPLPALWHWLYFLPLHRQSEIGPDGHAKRGGFLPPVPLPRRMWAGSQFEFRAPLRVGDDAHARVDDRRRHGKERPHRHAGVRQGATRDPPRRRTGRRAHRIPRHRLPRGAQARRRRAAAQGRAAERAWEREWVPDDVLLFRYSALTFNGHRIHYDRRYVTEVEGYPGLDRARPADRHAAARSAASPAARRRGGALRVPGRAPHLRHQSFLRVRRAAAGRQDASACGPGTTKAG